MDFPLQYLMERSITIQICLWFVSKNILRKSQFYNQSFKIFGQFVLSHYCIEFRLTHLGTSWACLKSKVNDKRGSPTVAQEW